eukprot:gnl/TRDRNA2_/TRDRNA2_177147_c0_seq4.p1 gnl/TRDRNA2_/TRDRNA2_177147_c0~~gnl/TRDRNA2_/TRDRNA2_177147_c0_seq4.p1  ORF type:complete len:526 (+),score=68.93 gnl/TRDRNA2_/TRDRNA2_177147_c0_seq4:26-1579(+)
MAAEPYIWLLLHEFSVQNLSSIVWAYATVRCTECSNMLICVSNAFIAASHRNRVLSFDLATYSWGLASMRLNVDAQTVQRIGDIAVTMLSKIKWPELSTIIWAVCVLDCRHDELFSAVTWLLRFSSKSRIRLDRHCITNLFWSFAKQIQLGSSEKDSLVDAARVLMPKVRRILSRLKGYQLNGILVAIAQMDIQLGSSHDADELFFAFAASANALVLDKLPIQKCVNLLAAFTSFMAVSDRIEKPKVCTHFQASLVTLCLARECELDQPCAMSILKMAPQIRAAMHDTSTELAKLAQLCMMKVQHATSLSKDKPWIQQALCVSDRQSTQLDASGYVLDEEAGEHGLQENDDSEKDARDSQSSESSGNVSTRTSSSVSYQANTPSTDNACKSHACPDVPTMHLVLNDNRGCEKKVEQPKWTCEGRHKVDPAIENTMQDPAYLYLNSLGNIDFVVANGVGLHCRAKLAAKLRQASQQGADMPLNKASCKRICLHDEDKEPPVRAAALAAPELLPRCKFW